MMERILGSIYTVVMMSVIGFNGGNGLVRLIEGNLAAASISLPAAFTFVLVWRKTEYGSWRTKQDIERLNQQIKEMDKR